MAKENTDGASDRLDTSDFTLTDDRSLGDRVYELLKEMILEGKIPLGTRLIEKNLAKRLDISRSPLREAIQRLQFEGLVRTVPRKGSYVIQFSAQELTDIFRVREQLEALAARLAATRITNRRLDTIENDLLRVQEILESSEEESYPRESERDFHETILHASGNGRLIDIMTTLHSQLQLLRRRSGASPERARKSLREHFAILETLRARDGEQAHERMRVHIQNSLANTLEALVMEGAGDDGERGR